MKFSIVIPVYNVEKYLSVCLDSVLKQTYDNYEIIGINDGSTDGSLSILDEYSQKDKRIKIISQKNKGLSATRNRGIMEAKGDYIFFLDSDDWIEKDTLEILSQKTTNEDMICFSGKLFYEDTKEELIDELLPETQMTGWNYYNEYALKTRKFSFVCAVLRLYKRSFLLNNNIFFKEGIFHEDNLFTPIVCYYAHTIKLISDCLYTYRIREGSIKHTVSIKYKTDFVNLTNDLAKFFIHIENINKDIIYKALSNYYTFYFYWSDKEEDKKILPLVNWDSFNIVASTKFKHRICYYLIKINPAIYRLYIKTEERIKNYLKHAK